MTFKFLPCGKYKMKVKVGDYGVKMGRLPIDF